jgi:hypothetical protein
MPAQNYVLLERIELNASAASVTFSNIPQTGYTDLKVVASARNNTTEANILLSFNGSLSNFTSKLLYGNGASASSASYTDSRGLNMNYSTATVNSFSNGELYIPNYTSSNYKSWTADTTQEDNISSPVYGFLYAGLWSQTAAINSITLTAIASSSFVANSTFSLYGLAALGTTPTIAPKATGGNRIDYDGTYWIHTFTSSGDFVPAVGLTCDYLVVAGGGGGAGQISQGVGGGGAGGLRSTVTATGGSGGLETALSLTAGTSYTVTVGAGGAGCADTGTTTAGQNSVFSTITSTGGGGGETNYGTVVKNGGSGGGAVNNTSSPGTGNSNEGFAGGNGGIGGGTAAIRAGGGGGGAGADGLAGVLAVSGGNGGAGRAISITGSSVNYGGGGGGGSGSGAGLGTFGGGTAGLSANGTAGTTNTGGGGGASYNATGGNGGSGIVIVRYLAA